MSISVGDFAEQLIAQENQKNTGVPTPPTFENDSSFYNSDATSQAPDISNVQVPNDFVNSIVENKEIVAEQPAEVRETGSTPTQPLNEVAELKSVVADLKKVLVEVIQTLTEMTTVGMGIGAPAPDKKKEDEDDLTKLLKKIKNTRKKSR